ncbi:MAG: hypothetical protein AAFR40_18900, partial [Pseudomonadota bacterium]
GAGAGLVGARLEVATCISKTRGVANPVVGGLRHPGYHYPARVLTSRLCDSHTTLFLKIEALCLALGTTCLDDFGLGSHLLVATAAILLGNTDCIETAARSAGRGEDALRQSLLHLQASGLLAFGADRRTLIRFARNAAATAFNNHAVCPALPEMHQTCYHVRARDDMTHLPK